MININGVDHIGLRVTEFSRSVAFYKQFGFEVICEDFRDPDLNVIELTAQEVSPCL